jgi:hypothetical protein
MGEALLRRPRDLAGAVEEGVLAVDVKVDGGGSAHLSIIASRPDAIAPVSRILRN